MASFRDRPKGYGYYTGTVTPAILSPAGDPYAGPPGVIGLAQARREEYDNPGGQAQCETGKDVHCGPLSDFRADNPTTAATTVPSACATWMGPSVAAMACDPAVLTSALQAGDLTEPGSLAVSGSGLDSSSAPGLVQDVGNPLMPGQTLTISGSPQGDTQLFIVTQVGSDLRTVAFDAKDLSLGAGQIHVASDGGATLQRPGQPALQGVIIQAQNNAPPAAPKIKRAVHRNTNVAITITAHGKTFVVLLARRGHIISRRRLTVNGTRKIIFAHAQTAARVQATTVSASNVPSKTTTRRLRP
jgi:hypothetical protein